jgi:hypothetical protein
VEIIITVTITATSLATVNYTQNDFRLNWILVIESF